MGKRKMDSDLHRIKLETGTVYQTSKGGNYYFRFQVKGERKCVSLKTANQEEAIRKAKALLPTVQATNLEVIATHVKVARKLAAQTKSLPISQIWKTYSTHPQRALPATMREQLAYEATLTEFINSLDRRIKQFSQITEADVIKFADYLRTTQISVSTLQYLEEKLYQQACNLHLNRSFDLADAMTTLGAVADKLYPAQ